MKRLNYIFLALLGTTLLAACNSSGTDSSSTTDGTMDASGGRGGTQNGFLSLSITDAPIDSAKEVWVQFYGVELKPTSTEDVVTLNFNPALNINLLALQGQDSFQMFSNAILPAGQYDWIRLNVNATNDGVLDSYIKLDDNSVHELDIPSGSESGLKIIGGLEVIANTPTSMTIDFDLRKSIVKTDEELYKLKPVLKLVDDSAVSSISGTVQVSALLDSSCPDDDPSTGNAVYLYNNLNTAADDVDNIEPEPVASALLTLNNMTGIYEYDFGFIPLGKYTAAFTCQANLDDPEVDDVIVFSRGTNINLANTDKVVIKTFR
jgi:hypothetical protein